MGVSPEIGVGESWRRHDSDALPAVKSKSVRRRRRGHSRPTAAEAELPRGRRKRGWEVAEREGGEVRWEPLPQDKARHGCLGFSIWAWYLYLCANAIRPIPIPLSVGPGIRLGSLQTEPNRIAEQAFGYSNRPGSQLVQN